MDPKKNKPYGVRLYSIASTRYGIFCLSFLCWVASFDVVCGAHISFSWIVSRAAFVHGRCSFWGMLWEDTGCAIIRETRRQQACGEGLWIVVASQPQLSNCLDKFNELRVPLKQNYISHA